MASNSRRTDHHRTSEKTSRKSVYMGVSRIFRTRHDSQATDRNMCQAIEQTFKEAVGNKERHNA
jgi:hypothetical protein